MINIEPQHDDYGLQTFHLDQIRCGTCQGPTIASHWKRTVYITCLNCDSTPPQDWEWDEAQEPTRPNFDRWDV
jgi:hypothetical protein